MNKIQTKEQIIDFLKKEIEIAELGLGDGFFYTWKDETQEEGIRVDNVSEERAKSAEAIIKYIKEILIPIIENKRKTGIKEFDE